MKTKFYLLAFLFFIAKIAVAQIDEEYKNSQDYLESLAGSYTNTVMTLDQRYANYKGSPYFIDSWKKGNIIDATNVTTKDIFIKYNAYENQLYVKLEKDNVLLLDNATLKGFVIQDGDTKHTFVLEDVLKYKKHFFEMIGRGHLMVLKKPHINMFELDSDSGYQLEKVFKFKSSPKYFIKVGGNKYKVLKRNKKSLIKAAPSLKVKIKRYIKKEKINLKKDEDLIKTIQFINDELKAKKEKEKKAKEKKD